jgi:hypothetical protein
MDTASPRRPQPTVGHAYPAQLADGVTTRTARRTATLERTSPRMVKTARRAGVDITYLGIAPLFAEPRAYTRPKTDWIIRPAADLSDAIVPAAEREALQRLVHAGIDFPLIYVAHEVPKSQLALPACAEDSAEPHAVTLDHATAAEAICSVPPPAGTRALTERLGRSSQQLLTALRTAVPIAGAVAGAPFVIAAAPFVPAGVAASALAAGLDPSSASSQLATRYPSRPPLGTFSSGGPRPAISTGTDRAPTMTCQENATRFVSGVRLCVLT